jgi:hypothetical protein
MRRRQVRGDEAWRHEARRRCEQGNADRLRIGGQVVELLPVLPRNAGRRHIEVSSKVERHRSVQYAAHGRDVIVGVG